MLVLRINILNYNLINNISLINKKNILIQIFINLRRLHHIQSKARYRSAETYV